MARKLGSPTLSRLGVSRDLEIENKAIITGLGLGLVAEMNLVELGLVAYICCRWTRICVIAVDMWYMAAEMMMVVYGSGDDDGGIWQR